MNPTSHTAGQQNKTGRVERRVPDRGHRDWLINVVHGDDPRPPQCDLHTDPYAEYHQCEVCKTFYRWRQRMYYRFTALDLKFVDDEQVYDDPAPQECPHQHVDNAVNRKTCDHCRARHNWQEREYNRARRQGIPRIYTDWDTLLPHLHELRDAGRNAADIAHAADCSAPTVRRLLAGGDARRFVRAEVAHRLLAVPLPERPRKLVPNTVGAYIRRVDATGTRRQIQAACLAGYSLAGQGRRLGWPRPAVLSWLTAATVPVEVADAVDDLFPTLMARPGADKTAAAQAAAKGWIAARYFSATNIDDPAYQPFALVSDPAGIYRRLRAMAWDGQGPAQVAAHIGEAPEQVEIWMEGGPAPAYARHMVAAAYESITGPGPDIRLAERARLLRWPPPLAWHDIDIDDMYARPHTGLGRGEHQTRYPLESQVHMALMGRVTAGDLLRDEKIRVVWKLHRAGWSDRRIGAWLRWNPDGDLDKAQEAVCQFRKNAEIAGFGLRNGQSNSDVMDGLVITPTAL